MVIQVMNRYKIIEEASRQVAPNTAIISISSRGTAAPLFNKINWLKAVLTLYFNDEDTKAKGGMTAEDGILVSSFIKDIVDKDVERLIVHCDAGISRSAGVAAAIMKYLGGSDMPIFGNRCYSPNMNCYTLTLNALMESES